MRRLALGLLLLSACGAPQGLRPPTAADVASAQSAPLAEPAGREPRLQLCVTILAVGDLAHSVAFYRDVFGWPLRTNTQTFVAFDLGGGASLGLYTREGFGSSAGKAPQALAYGDVAGTELYLLFDDPAPYLERLRVRGARVLSALAARPWGDEAAYFADPDGNVLAVARRLPEPAPEVISWRRTPLRGAPCDSSSCLTWPSW